MKIMIRKYSKERSYKILEVVKELHENNLVKVKDRKDENNHILKSDCDKNNKLLCEN
jgi:hypothetical protein